MSLLGLRKKSLFFAAVLSAGLLLVPHQSVEAAPNGSWGGSSGGSWGGSSGGSWGGSWGGSSGGLLGGRRPLRNLLGRISARFSGGSFGSSGGSWGSSGGSLGTSYGSSGGSYGSSGGSLGSSSYVSSGLGTCYGSTGMGGSNYGSIGMSYGSTGSSSLTSVAPSWGIDQSTGPIMAPPLNYPAPGVSDPGVSFGAQGNLAPIESSYQMPLYDSGYSLNPDGFGPGAVSPGSLYDGEVPIEGGTIDPGMAQPESYYNDNGGSAIPGSEATESQPPPPGPASDDSTQIDHAQQGTLVLNVVVPREAKLFINDKLTRTTGEKRSFVSRHLKPNRDYHYYVKAVLVRDGKQLVRSKLVTVKAGSSKTLAINFQSAPTTTLALEVPRDAQVKLCGKPTSTTGTVRHYATDRLKEGETWNDYLIEVSVRRNGKTITRKKTIDLLAGKTVSLSFDFDDATQNQVAGK